jgi:hypothetical protein
MRSTATAAAGSWIRKDISGSSRSTYATCCAKSYGALARSIGDALQSFFKKQTIRSVISKPSAP